MKHALLTVVMIAAVSTNCSASEIAGTAKTVTDGLGMVTTAAVYAAGGDEPTTTSTPVIRAEPTKKDWKPQWFKDAQAKLDEVQGGREAIGTYKQKVVDLQRENLQLRAEAKFMNKNSPEFISAMEQACMLFDAGGIRGSLEATSE